MYENLRATVPPDDDAHFHIISIFTLLQFIFVFCCCFYLLACFSNCYCLVGPTTNTPSLHSSAIRLTGNEKNSWRSDPTDGSGGKLIRQHRS